MTGTVTVSGSTVYGQTLTATLEDDTNGTGERSYQWVRDGVDIGGETGQTYLLAEADVGMQISVKISTTDTTSYVTGDASALIERADCEVTPIETPVLSAKTYESITVTEFSGYEYKIVLAGGAVSLTEGWQDEFVFNSLDSSTDYDIYQRVKQTTTHKASAISSKLEVATGPAPLSVTAEIVGTAVYGETLTINITDTNNSGVLSYQWQREGVDIVGATAETYTIVQADITNHISVKFTSSVETGDVTVTMTDAVVKADSTPAKGVTPEWKAKQIPRLP